MDELELLKKDWKRQAQDLPKLSYEQLYQMILKKSSSVVKWLLIICIAEFVLWASLDIVFRQIGTLDDIEQYGLKNFTLISYILSYGILIYFIIRFYINYKRITTTDSAKVLMRNILNTRKTVKHYVWTILSFITLSSFFSVFLLYHNNSFAMQTETNEPLPLYIFILITILFIGVFIGVLALVYRLVYGMLTDKLKVNYEELERLEV